jgi:hypothetical protein
VAERDIKLTDEDREEVTAWAAEQLGAEQEPRLVPSSKRAELELDVEISATASGRVRIRVHKRAGGFGVLFAGYALDARGALVLLSNAFDDIVEEADRLDDDEAEQRRAISEADGGRGLDWEADGGRGLDWVVDHG